MSQVPAWQRSVQAEPAGQDIEQVPRGHEKSQVEPSAQVQVPFGHSPPHVGFWPWQVTLQGPPAQWKEHVAIGAQSQLPLEHSASQIAMTAQTVEQGPEHVRSHEQPSLQTHSTPSGQTAVQHAPVPQVLQSELHPPPNPPSPLDDEATPPAPPEPPAALPLAPVPKPPAPPGPWPPAPGSRAPPLDELEPPPQPAPACASAKLATTTAEAQPPRRIDPRYHAPPEPCPERDGRGHSRRT
jgi:hypothetical protein